MIFRILAVALAMTQLTVLSSTKIGLEELARSESWEKILQVATRRAHQLPLSAEQSLIAAQAARELGDEESEKSFLRVVAAGDDQDLARLAEVQLAEVLCVTSPDLAVQLALPSLRAAPSWQVRESATESATRALLNNVGPDQRRSLENVASKLPHSLRRRLALGLALSDEQGGRRRLDDLLAGSTSDLVALEAADALNEYQELSSVEQWRIAKTFYRHALYGMAVPLLDSLASGNHSSIPAEEVAFLRGRCAFRQGRWQEAISWYRKAIPRTRSADRRADLEVHIGRCYELSEQMDEAVAAAQRAVRLKTTDDRRLFLARLRLRRSEPELAAQGIARLRGRAARDRADLMLGAYVLAHGDRQMARRRLASVRRQPWIGPAAVLTARLDSEDGAVGQTVQMLESNAARLDAFWAAQARAVMATLPASSIEAWRAQQQEEVKKSTGSSQWRALGRWGALETDPDQLTAIRLQVSSTCGLSAESGTPTFPPGLAARLWETGLERAAIRWDASGVPRGDAAASAWSAEKMLAFGMPWRALRTADGAWRQAGAGVPLRAFPEKFQKLLFPLPDPPMVKRIAADTGVPWSLLAAVVREESRWDPRALSAVGARGLVQLMPATAAVVAQSLGETPPKPEELFDPAVSLRLGAAEIGRLLREFSGRQAPAIAAYNAGEDQARLWLDQCGGSCTDALYLVNISFSATRDYTGEVMASALSYASLYDVAR